MEKAGIMKPGVPVVIGQQEYEAAEEVLISSADRLGCPLHVYAQDFSAHEEHGRLVYQDGDGLMDLPLPALPGRHQYANAAAAISAVKVAGFALEEKAVETAMRTVFWPARLQRLTAGDLVTAAPEGSEIWLDGGHNPGAGEVIAEALAGFEERDPRPLYLVIGMINTKDPFGFFEHFAGLATYVYCAPIKGTDAFIDPVALASSAADAGLSAEPVSSIGEALEHICMRARADQPPPRILIGGSLYFAGNGIGGKRHAAALRSDPNVNAFGFQLFQRQFRKGQAGRRRCGRRRASSTLRLAGASLCSGAARIISAP